MTNWIESLNAATARRVLAAYAVGNAQSDQIQECPPALQTAMAAEFGIPAEAATEDDVVRAALWLLCDDPDRNQHLRILAESPQVEAFDLATLGVVTAVLVVLQTHIKFERHKDGKWSLKIEKKPAGDKLLGKLAGKFLSLVGLGGN